MKRLFLVLFAISSLTAQQSGIEQSLDLTTLSTGEHLLHWYGKSGRSYFVQVSDSNDSLTNWRWGPIIEAGNDEVISHEVGSIGDKGFWRLKYTDQVPGPGENLDTADFDSDGLSNLTEISYQPPLTPTDPLNPDSDGDGMTDGFERTYGFDPNNSDEDSDGVSDGSGDSDEDGLSNVDEALSDTDPLNPNSDGDSLLDGEDADPKEILVDWEKAAESSYMLIDVNAPPGSWPEDLNDEGDVLFRDGISSGGNWLPRQIPLGSGTDPDDTSYDIAYQGWNHFNNDRLLLGYSELTFTEGQGAGGGFTSPVFMPEGHSSPSLVLDTADLWNPYPHAFETLGVSTNGQMVVRIKSVADTYKHIDRYSAAGAIIGQMNGSDGFHPSGGFYGHGEITPTGWVASNQTREATESQLAADKVGLWTPNNNLVPLPPEAQGWGYPVCVTDLPNDAVGMTVGNWNGSNRTGRVFLPDANGDYQYVASLSSRKIDRFAGDGTAITFDNKLWRNGKLIPLRDLCPRYGELLDEGWSFSPLKANQNGVYLIQAEGPNGEAETKLVAPVTIVPDDNMAGVVGDMVQSVNSRGMITHFVSPKKTTELAPDHVVLKASGITADQITPGHANQIAEWEGGEAVPNDPLKRRVKRDAASKIEVKIKNKQDGTVIAQTDVWIVWTTATVFPGVATFGNFIGGALYEVNPNPGWRFVFKIEPYLILDQTDIDRPMLSGPFSKETPGFGLPYTIKPSLGDGDTAERKWDVSRQYQLTIRNPAGIPKADLQQGNVAAAWIVNQPAAVDSPISYPASDSEGNDDPIDGVSIDEDSNPYAAFNLSPTLNHQVGEISSYDAPSLRVLDGWGAPNRTYSVELNFNEFARVQLWDGKRATGQFWFRISDLVKWHHYLDATYDSINSKWNDSASSFGTGHPKP